MMSPAVLKSTHRQAQGTTGIFHEPKYNMKIFVGAYVFYGHHYKTKKIIGKFL